MGEDVAYGLYLHVPFCVRRCRYCDFATSATRREDPVIARYVRALETLVRRLRDAGLTSGVRTAYVGGGTPTMAGQGLAGLAATVRATCPGLAEFSSEANPESLTNELAQALADAGLTRVSLGVQSLDDAELARLGRAHDARAARVAMDVVRSAGLRLSCDLMCGIPLQTPESWRASLVGVIDGGATHVSCYPLMVEEGTPLFDACEAGREAWPDDDAQASLMEVAERVLGQAGMRRYEVASYAAPGCACAHNVGYWTGRPYLGLGSHASGMLAPAGFAALADAVPLLCTPADDDTLAGALAFGPTDGRALAGRMLEAGEGRVARVRLTMTDDAREFAQAVEAGAPLRVELETLTAREAVCEDLMLGARTAAGCQPELLGRARTLVGGALDETLADVCARGLARMTPEGALAPTERGWLLGNSLYFSLWNLAS